MESSHDEGLVQQYAGMVAALAVKAEQGRVVDAELVEVIGQAREHFDVCSTSNASANTMALRGKMKIAAQTTDESQPRTAQVFLDAVRLLS